MRRRLSWLPLLLAGLCAALVALSVLYGLALSRPAYEVELLDSPRMIFPERGVPASDR